MVCSDFFLYFLQSYVQSEGEFRDEIDIDFTQYNGWGYVLRVSVARDGSD